MLIGFLSDAHGNVEAFEQGLMVLRNQGCHRIFFLGDSVGYLPGDAVVTCLAENQIVSICGNHDDMLARGRRPSEQDDVYLLTKTRSVISDANLSALGRWPSQRRFRTPNGELLLIHGSPKDHLTGYIYPDTNLDQFEIGDCRAVFCGHTHRPFVRKSRDVLFVNAGSVGLPRDDGRLGSAACYDTESHEAEILRFDITAATETALHRCGPVHDSVRSLLKRKAPSVIGRLV